MKRSAILAAALAAAMPAYAAQSLDPGDVAIISWIDNGSPDSFAFVTLAEIAAGTTVLFTDNGWTGSAYRNTGNTFKGNENLASWTTNNAIAAGTIVQSLGASPAWTWSFDDPGAAIALSQSGDQIYAFQSSAFDVRLATNHLYVLDNTNAFENATNTNTGNIAPGLVAGVSAVSLSSPNRFMSVNSSVLSGPAQTKDQWLATFAEQANWSFASAGSLPAGSIQVSPVPEPSAYVTLIAGLGLVGLALARRRPH